MSNSPSQEIKGFIMYAIVKLGNKQFKVQAGDYIRSPFLKDAKNTIALPVLAVGDKKNLLMDSSDLKSAKVTAQILREGKSKKVLVFKKKRRKGYRRTKGHRQKFTELKILEIAAGGSKSSAPAAKASSASSKKASATKASTKSSKKTAPVKKASAKTTAKKTQKDN